MQIKITTPYSESSYNMGREAAAEILKIALKYSEAEATKSDFLRSEQCPTIPLAVDEETTDNRLDKFVSYLEKEERAKNTINTYRKAVVDFYQRYEYVTKENMIKFKQEEIERHKPKTANLKNVAMNQYCKFIGKGECCVKPIKVPDRKSVGNVITESEYKKLLDGLASDEDWRRYWMVEYFAKTGARVSEFVRYERKHLKDEKAVLMTKGKIREILIPKALIKESRGYFESQPENRWLFPNRYGNQMSTRAIAATFANMGKKYGIRKEAMHPHSFRHFFAIQFLKHNNNLSLLADLMGHSSINTTQIYVRLSEEQQKKALNEAMKKVR